MFSFSLKRNFTKLFFLQTIHDKNSELCSNYKCFEKKNKKCLVMGGLLRFNMTMDVKT